MLIEAAQRFEDHKAQDTRSTQDITNWTPDAFYFDYGPTRPSNNGNKGTKQKQRAEITFRNNTSGSGQPTGPNRPSNFSAHFSGGYGSPTNGNNKGPGKQNSSFKSGNGRLLNTGKSGSREPPSCFAFNQYEKAFCELPHNQCQHKRSHKCQTCGH